ncbi:hypothetical protein CRUP_011308 [Coryphaenoides rupestris]|nr:hypothetical protein CRUP_011308 [Coryphaenoides rupestris]
MSSLEDRDMGVAMGPGGSSSSTSASSASASASSASASGLGAASGAGAAALEAAAAMGVAAAMQEEVAMAIGRGGRDASEAADPDAPPKKRPRLLEGEAGKLEERCEISKNLCCRNLAVEKAVSELPADCTFCLKQFPRSSLERHQKEECQDRVTQCKYKRIGCPWQGPFHELPAHEGECSHPTKTGTELMGILGEMDQSHRRDMQLYNTIFGLLCYEKIGFTGTPYRTDDFITRLYYETPRFTVLNQTWVLKARVNDSERNPNLSCKRTLSFQLILKSKCTNGHLMCAGCFIHLLADSRLKEEQATCPNCRCEISKNLCCRNLAVEKAVSELPADCTFCLKQFPRSSLERHQKEECQDRVTQCKYKRIGCPWQGPFHELPAHEGECSTRPRRARS